MDLENEIKEVLSNTSITVGTQSIYMKAIRKWINYFQLKELVIPTEDMYKEFAQYLYKEQNYTYLTYRNVMYSIIYVFKYYGIHKNNKDYNIPNIANLIEILSDAYKQSDKVDQNNLTPYATQPLEDTKIDKILYYLYKEIKINCNIKHDKFLRNLRMYIALHIAKETGLRRSDIMGIKYENITINNTKLVINLIIKKTGKAYNKTIDNFKLIKIYKQYIKIIDFKDNNYLFGYINEKTLKQDRQWGRVAFYNHFYKILSILKISKIGHTLVSFRKSLAQKLYNNKHNIESIMNQFRWSSTACRFYVKHKFI
jgi:integrase